MGTASIFISYRRADSQAETERIYDYLVDEFGSKVVFKDVDNIPFGISFQEELRAVLNTCCVALVVLGRSWATVTKANGTRRLDDPNDYVRFEIESALKRDIPVIPILLEGASMPSKAVLPLSLHPLISRNAIDVGYDPRFRTDMNRLIGRLEDILQSDSSKDYFRSGREVGGKDFSGVDLSERDFIGGDFRRAALIKTNFSNSNMVGADLSKANMDGAVCIRTDLSRANLSGCRLRAVDFSWASLRGANLNSADLSAAQLEFTDICGADLRGARYPRAILSEAVHDDKTLW